MRSSGETCWEALCPPCVTQPKEPTDMFETPTPPGRLLVTDILSAAFSLECQQNALQMIGCRFKRAKNCCIRLPVAICVLKTSVLKENKRRGRWQSVFKIFNFLDPCGHYTCTVLNENNGVRFETGTQEIICGGWKLFNQPKFKIFTIPTPL